MNWDEIELPEDLPNLNRPEIGALGALDYAKLLVISKVINKSVAAILQTAVLTYLQRNWADHETRLALEAKRQKRSPEELFNDIVKTEIEAKSKRRKKS